MSDLAEAIEPYLDRSFTIFGHSLGAAIAFELSILWKRRYGVEPSRLIVSGCRPPHQFQRVVTEPVSDEEMVWRIQRLGGADPQVLQDKEILQLLLPALRADLAMFDSYILEHDHKVDCDILVLAGIHDPVAPISSMDEWGRMTTGSAEVRRFNGGHVFILERMSEVVDLLVDEVGR